MNSDETPEVTLRIGSEHLCYWSDSIESTANELLEARTQLSEIEADNAKLVAEILVLKEQLAVFTEMYQRSAILRNKYRSALESIANDKEFSHDVKGNFVRLVSYVEIAKEALRT